jgi:hypothetical protein
MKTRDAGLFLFGSALVYVAVAACTGSADRSAPRPTGAGAATPNGSSGTSGRDSGLIDAIANPVPTAKADPTSGSRLKAEYMIGDDGSKEYVPGVWFDTMRNEVCSFALAGDSQQRCLPQGGGASAFADASCTMPIIAVATGCTAPGYAVVVDSGTCGQAAGATHVHAVGAAANPTTLYLQSGGQCFQAGTATAGYNYYAVGAEVPAAAFVSASTKHD